VTGAAFDRITGALAAHGSRVQVTGPGQASAQCPAHDDRHASLSISPRTQGDPGVVLKCHRGDGCAVDEITAALDMSAADLFDERRQPGRRSAERGQIVATYDYVDELGELLYQVCRYEPKDFRQRRPDGRGGWTWKLDGTRRVPYRLPQLLEAAKAGATIYVAEGEKDVHALEAAGAVATCNSGGAGKWLPEFSPVLADADVVIVSDRDDGAGREHAAAVAVSLNGLARSIRVVEAATGKDAHDHLTAGHSLDDFVNLDLSDSPPAATQSSADHEAAELNEQTRFNEEVNKEARQLRIRRAARAKVDAEDDTPDPPDLYINRDQLRNLPHIEPLIEGVIPRHTYKSFLCVDWGLCLATGKAWQARTAQRVRVLYIAGEGAYGLNQRIDAWEYAWHTKVDPDWFITRRLALDLHNPGPTFDRLLTRIQDGGFGLVVVDTLRRVSGRADGNTTDMGAVVDNLAHIKQATDHGTVLAISHTDKSDTDSRGFSGIEDDADFVWHAKRDQHVLTLELTKMKDGPSGTKLHLQAKPALDSLILSAGPDATPAAGTTDSQIKILDTLRDLFPDGAPNGVLHKATALSESTYYRALKQLRDAGHVLPRGTKTRRIWELAQPTYSHELPPDEPTPDQHNSHNSHELPHQLPLTPVTPTTLRSGSGDRKEVEQP
jgi:hypothetical protein